MKKMKIAQVITRMDWGGSPDIIRALYLGLDKERYEVELFTGPTSHPSKETTLLFKECAGKISIIHALKRDIDPLKDIVAIFRLYRIFKDGHFDLVHTHTAKAGFTGRIAAFFARVPVIVHTPHGHNFYGYFGPLLTWIIIRVERLLGAVTSRLIVLTELEGRDNLQYNIVPTKKIAVAKTGVELERYRFSESGRASIRKELSIPPDAVVIGMVGRLETVKGARYFIEAASSVAAKSPNAWFVIAGEGSLRKALEGLASKVGIGDRLRFTGWREDVASLLSAFDILVLPSLNEAVGMILIEAQAIGIPVIASDVGGVAETIDPGKTGMLVRAGDSGALADGILSLINDREKRADMGAMGKEWVAKRYDAKAMVQKIEDLYEGLLHNE